MIYYSKEKKELVIPSGFVAGGGNCKESYDNGYSDGFNKGNAVGYDEGVTAGRKAGKDEQKALIQPLKVTENGTYENENGYNPVVVSVPLSNKGGIYERFRLRFSEDTVIPREPHNAGYYKVGIPEDYYQFTITETSGGDAIGKTLRQIIDQQIVVPAGVWIMDVALLVQGRPTGDFNHQSGQLYWSLDGYDFPNCTVESDNYYIILQEQ